MVVSFKTNSDITLENHDFSKRQWHKMKECWLENGKSKDFQHLMKEALLEAYDTFCIEII